MDAFLARFGEKVIGTLSGFDRLVLRGILRQLSHVSGMLAFLYHKKILLKELTEYFKDTTAQIKARAEALAQECDRPFDYIYSSQVRKDERALQILSQRPVDSGLICVLRCVEPCMTYEVHRSRERKQLELRYFEGKCLHLYHYFLHPRFGFMSARLQTWFPFNTQICLNGREWLSKALERSGIDYRRSDNCFQWIEHPERAQYLMDCQLRTNWTNALEGIRKAIHPLHEEIFRDTFMDYYWTQHQAEWATDLMFDRPEALAEIYPSLTIHAMTQFSSGDVMRFLGRKVTGNFKGEIVSDFKDRPEGIRVKHRINRNAVKMYDKEGSVLRVETTINNTRDIRVFRKTEGKPESEPAWRPLRKGIADIHRLSQVAQGANERYLEALATIKDTTSVYDLVKDVCRPTKFKGKRVRALRPWGANDTRLLATLNRGEFVVTGFRNRDLVQLLAPDSVFKNADRYRREAARVTRQLRMLRAHKLIRKIPKAHRYQLTQRGRQIITAILAAHNASVSSLLEAA